MKEVNEDISCEMEKKNVGGSWILSGLLEKKISFVKLKGEIVFDRWKKSSNYKALMTVIGVWEI